jgi:hypothetical protein
MCPNIFIAAMQSCDATEQHTPPHITANGAKVKQQPLKAFRNRGILGKCGYAGNVLTNVYDKFYKYLWIQLMT